MQNAFVALLALQSARGMHGAVPVASGGPWAHPELRAVTEMVAVPVRMLEETFLSGGPFDRPDATAWVFQVLQVLPRSLKPLLAAALCKYDSRELEWCL